MSVRKFVKVSKFHCVSVTSSSPSFPNLISYLSMSLALYTKLNPLSTASRLKFGYVHASVKESDRDLHVRRRRINKIASRKEILCMSLLDNY